MLLCVVVCCSAQCEAGYISEERMQKKECVVACCYVLLCVAVCCSASCEAGHVSEERMQKR